MDSHPLCCLTLGDSGGDPSAITARPPLLTAVIGARLLEQPRRWARTVVKGLSFSGAPPAELHIMTAHGCEEGDDGLLHHVVQAVEVTDLVGVGDEGRCGSSKGQRTGGMRWRAELPSDDISMAQAVLASEGAVRSGRRWLDRWPGGLGDRWCARVSYPSRALPPPTAGSSSGLWAVSSLASAGDPRSGGHLWSYAGRSGSAFGGGVTRGTNAASTSSAWV
jgi:hypothetical protein